MAIIVAKAAFLSRMSDAPQMQVSGLASPALTPEDAVDPILALHRGNILPDDMTIRGMIEEGRS